ncbi:MAG: hypothetical protein U0441_24900 [Polyangiaceae bacterium]
MTTPEDDTQLCWLCERNLSEKTYTRGAEEHPVCAACFDRLSVQDAYEGALGRIGALDKAGRPEEALAALDAILEANRERDHDGWLARSIASHRALSLSLAGRHAEAEKELRGRAQLGFVDVWDRYEYGLAMAKTLEALGRDAEAVAALEDALSHQEPQYSPTAMSLLSRLAGLSEKLGRPLESKWMDLANAAASSYGVAMPAGDSPSQVFSALHRLLRSRPARPPEERG